MFTIEKFLDSHLESFIPLGKTGSVGLFFFLEHLISDYYFYQTIILRIII